MAKKKIANPFLVEEYAGPTYFCDRKKETEMLESALVNGNNVTLTAPRRMGKSGLIWHVFQDIERKDKDAVCVYFDILGTRNMTEFVELFARTVLSESEKKGQSLFRKVVSFLSTLRPVMTFDSLTGNPVFSVDMTRTQAENSLERIFDSIEQSGRTFYVAIDEFQQLTCYQEGYKPEALLRSRIQLLRNARFVYSGSSMRLMSEMFASAARPFYASSQLMSLDAIGEKAYFKFAEKFFKEKDLALSEQVFHFLHTCFEGHTWYMQKVLNMLYARAESVVEEAQVLSVIDSFLKENTLYFQSLVRVLSANQTAVLKAVAKEGEVKELRSAPFILKYALPASSSIALAVKFLVENDLLYRNERGVYRVYDRFFGIWLARR